MHPALDAPALRRVGLGHLTGWRLAAWLALEWLRVGGGVFVMLSRVIYELFESEIAMIEAAKRGETVFLGRQLRLEFTHNPQLFIAWTWGALPDAEYHVGRSPKSFCTGAAEIEFDATASQAWTGLIGQDLVLKYRDTEQQILEISGSGAAVFCCSFEGSWHRDVLFVGRELPTEAL
jgi:hypothetical protein